MPLSFHPFQQHCQLFDLVSVMMVSFIEEERPYLSWRCFDKISPKTKTHQPFKHTTSDRLNTLNTPCRVCKQNSHYDKVCQSDKAPELLWG